MSGLLPHEKAAMREMIRAIARAETYRVDEIVPIPAQCAGRQRHDWTGRDAIRAPSLRNCLCSYCGATLRPHPNHPPVIDAETRRHNRPRQLALAETQS